jgi:hypothetical protein
LYARDRSPFATGVARFYDHEPIKPVSDPRIYLEVKADRSSPSFLAMVDTAAPWCIFKPELGEVLRESFEVLSAKASLSSRLGDFKGELLRGRLFLPALDGEYAEVETTVFFSPQWPGENFLGYEGLLQRIRFAVDPHSNLFYFGDL